MWLDQIQVNFTRRLIQLIIISNSTYLRGHEDNSEIAQKIALFVTFWVLKPQYTLWAMKHEIKPIVAGGSANNRGNNFLKGGYYLLEIASPKVS